MRTIILELPDSLMWLVHLLFYSFIKPTLVGGQIMYSVKADIPDVLYKINLPNLVDSEGNKVKKNLVVASFTSDNESAVAVIPDDAPNGPKTGTIHFGGPTSEGDPAIANLVATIADADDGTVYGSLGAQFQVVSGDIAQVVGGSLAFEGLTENTPVTS
jgi:hypothetical protein